MYLAGTQSLEYFMIIFLLYRYSVWYSWDAVGCKFHRPSWHSFIKFYAMYLVIRRVETTSMEYGSTKYFIQKELFQSKNKERKITGKTWSTKNTLSQAIHISKKISIKSFPLYQFFIPIVIFENQMPESGPSYWMQVVRPLPQQSQGKPVAKLWTPRRIMLSLVCKSDIKEAHSVSSNSLLKKHPRKVDIKRISQIININIR